MSDSSGEVSAVWKILHRKDAILRDVFDAFLSLLKPNIVCDVGCFNGDESARFQRLAPQASLFAFEANKQNIDDFISKRTDMDRVKLEYMAVADVDGEVTFNVLQADADASDWRRAAGSLNLRNDDIAYKSVTVPSIRLDTYFADAIVQGKTFVLWIDVEGALERVFAGAPKTLSQTLFMRAEVERREFWQGQKLADHVIEMAEDTGFMVLADSWTPEAFEQSDVLFLNKRWLNLCVGD